MLTLRHAFTLEPLRHDFYACILPFLLIRQLITPFDDCAIAYDV